jgi:hypothetical protein
MKKRFPFLGVTPGVVDFKHVKAMGKAARLFDHLVHRQTSPDGTVSYGKTMTYAELSNEFPGAPPRRTLQRWMGKLREGGYARTTAVRLSHITLGFTVKILAPKKWATQLGLPFGKPVQKPAEKVCIAPPPPTPQVAAPSRHLWRGKSLESKESILDKDFRAEPRRAGLTHTFNLEAKARRLEREIELQRELLVGHACESASYVSGCRNIDRLSKELGYTLDLLEEMAIVDARLPAGRQERKTG